MTWHIPYVTFREVNTFRSASSLGRTVGARAWAHVVSILEDVIRYQVSSRRLRWVSRCVLRDARKNLFTLNQIPWCVSWAMNQLSTYHATSGVLEVDENSSWLISQESEWFFSYFSILSEKIQENKYRPYVMDKLLSIYSHNKPIIFTCFASFLRFASETAEPPKTMGQTSLP